MTKNLASIIITNYNKEKFIKKSVQSALNQNDFDQQLELDNGENNSAWERVKKVWHEVLKLKQKKKAQEIQINDMKQELEQQTRSGEALTVLSLLKKRARLKRSATRSRWIAKVLKSYRSIHVALGQLTLIALVIHILHALKWLS